jgi:hypothetical protein
MFFVTHTQLPTQQALLESPFGVVTYFAWVSSGQIPRKTGDIRE